MIENTKLPCIDCIVLAMCIPIKHRHMYTLINILGKRCSLLFNYLTLSDTDIGWPDIDAAQEYKDIFNARQRPRIRALHSYMKWPHDLDDYLDVFPKTPINRDKITTSLT